MKTSELTGAALDWAVARCEVDAEFIGEIDDPHFYSTDWALAGPIIKREGVSLNRITDALWEATIMGEWTEDGPTPLIAAMRCYAGSRLGNEIEIPEQLMEGV
jgi:hypothetical protein